LWYLVGSLLMSGALMLVVRARQTVVA